MLANAHRLDISNPKSRFGTGSILFDIDFTIAIFYTVNNILDKLGDRIERHQHGFVIDERISQFLGSYIQ